MRSILSLITLFGLAAAANSFYPVAIRNGNNYQYIGFGPNFYGFALPGLSLSRSAVTPDGGNFAAPGSLSGNLATLSNEAKTGTYTVDITVYTVNFNAGVPTSSGPYNPYPDSVVTDRGGYKYTFLNTNITKTDSNGNFLGAVQLPKSYNTYNFFSISNGTLYLSAATGFYRGTSDYDYFSIDPSTLTIIDGPVSLPNTASSGCPTVARDCAVNVLQSLTIVDGVVVWVYTKKQESGAFQVWVNTYNQYCGVSTNTFDDAGLAPSYAGNSKCPAAIDCGQLARCGDLCINPARSYCCSDGTSGFYYIDGQPNPAATCTSTTNQPQTIPKATNTQSTGNSGNGNTNGNGNTGNTNGGNGNTGNTNGNSGNTNTNAGNTNTNAGNTNGNGNTNGSTGNTNGNSGNTNTNAGNSGATTPSNNNGNDNNGNGPVNRDQTGSAATVTVSIAVAFVAAILL